MIKSNYGQSLHKIIEIYTNKYTTNIKITNGRWVGFSKFPGAGGASSYTFWSGVVRPTEERRRKRPLRQLTTADGDVTR